MERARVSRIVAVGDALPVVASLVNLSLAITFRLAARLARRLALALMAAVGGDSPARLCRWPSGRAGAGAFRRPPFALVLRRAHRPTSAQR